MFDLRKTVVKDVPGLFLRVHQVIEQHAEFAVIFRCNIVYAKPLCDGRDDARGRRADNEIVGPFLLERPGGDLLFVFIPVALDLFIQIIYHCQNTEHLALQLIIRQLSHFVQYQGLHHAREKSEPQLGLTLHAPESKTYTAIRIENSPVKIIYIHNISSLFPPEDGIASAGRACWCRLYYHGFRSLKFDALDLYSFLNTS